MPAIATNTAGEGERAGQPSVDGHLDRPTVTPMSLPRPDLSAVKDAIPLFIPAIPFGLVLGVAIIESAMPDGVGWSTNLFIFAGAAQLATVSLAATSTWVTLVLTAAVINLRHVMYSAALAPRFETQPRWFRWVGPYFLIDQLYVLASAATERDDDDWRRYYLSVGVSFFVCWMATVTLGLFVGSAIPEEWRLDVAPAVMFAGLVIIGITTRPAAVAALAAVVTTFIALDVPNNGGILIGAIVGVTAGYLAERAAERDGTSEEQAQ